MSQLQDHVVIKIEGASSDNSEVPSNSNQNLDSTQLYIEENPIENASAETLKEVLPHNGKPISKMAISPQSKYVLTYSQEDKSFVGWFVNDDNSGPLTIDEDIGTLILSKKNICDFKVSDKKVILYDYFGLGEINLSFSNDE